MLSDFGFVNYLCDGAKQKSFSLYFQMESYRIRKCGIYITTIWIRIIVSCMINTQKGVSYLIIALIIVVNMATFLYFHRKASSTWDSPNLKSQFSYKNSYQAEMELSRNTGNLRVKLVNQNSTAFDQNYEEGYIGWDTW